ncbi:MAG TPA: hypothetical protein PKE64_31030 [Anaerolineae bacterium]|nr:hypothetical protein [Anaerolineae bacterium]HMR68466.1 hypothetical protein [Anaerolineae bacterium]
MNTILDNDTFTLRVYPDKKIVHHQIHKFVYGQAFQEVLTKGAELFEKHRCTKWLSDDRGNSALRQEDLQWGQTVWEPRVMKAGWKHWALVLPEKVVGQMNMKKLVERYSQLGLNVKAFSDPDQAMTWLEQQ